MKEYTIDELNNMHVEELEKVDNEVYRYWKKIRAVLEFQKEVEKEE